MTSDILIFMRSCGCEIIGSHLIIDDKKHRAFPAGHRKPTIEYCFKTCSDGSVIGWFRDYRFGETHKYISKQSKELSKEERAEFKKRIDSERKARQRRLDADRKAAQTKAKAIWDKAVQGQHAYAKRKQVDTKGARIWNGLLIVPAYKNGELVTLQMIQEDGQKRFLKNGEIDGAYGSIGRDTSKIYICEGWATAKSVYAACGYVAVWAFNSGNLKKVAVSLRGKYPESEIIICADNDQWTKKPDGKPYNAGVEAGQEAARAVGALIVWPDVAYDDAEKRTDWNDIHCTDGLDRVQRDVAQAKPADTGAELTIMADPEDSALPDYELPPLEAYENEFKSVERRHVQDWRELLITNGEGKLVKSSLKNSMLFLEHHEDYRDVFRTNDFQKEIFLAKCPIWEDPDLFEVHRLEDNDISQCAASLERFGLSASTDTALKAIQVVSEKNAFHPAREYFNQLQWDGIDRLSNWLSFYLGAEGDSVDYLSFIGKKWITAAVKRVFEPGCKFDHILVMEGSQGLGKSTAFETLATFGDNNKKESYFTDNIKLSDIQNKDTILLLQGSIIVELAELAGFRKQDDEEIKGWITTKEDRCRRPYGKTVTHFPRQFVLCGTTNNHEYLKDPTGNRRYWPFKTARIALDSLERDRVQLWAQAMALYRSGLYIGPTQEESKLAEAAQIKRRSYDTWEDDVLNAVNDLGLMARSNGFKIKAIFSAMGLGIKDQDAKNTRRISNILQQNGYENEVKWINGKSSRVWVKHD